MLSVDAVAEILADNFSRKWVKIAEMPALATDIMKKPSAPKVLISVSPLFFS
jgi:hypothetical protein